MTITNPSALVAAPEGSGVAVYAPLPEIHLIAPEPSAIGAEFRDKIGDNLTDRPRIFIQTGTGGIAGLFEFFPFIHEPLNSLGGQPNNG